MGDLTPVESWLRWLFEPERLLTGLLVIPLLLLGVASVVSRVLGWYSRRGWRRQRYELSQERARQAQARRNERDKEKSA